MALAIGNITVTPTYSTRSRTQVLNGAGLPIPIWSSLALPINEGPDGSASCCTLKIPTGAPVLPLAIQGVWPGLTAVDTYTLKAQINGVNLLIANAQPSPKASAFVLPANTIQLVNVPQFPTRYAGDWTWLISPNGLDPWTVCATKTRLELNFVFAPPPAGPLVAPNVGTRSRPNFNNEYPVDLFRLFLSNYNVAIPLDPRQWYFDRTMQTIWNLGLTANPMMATTRLFQYEAISGAPAYVDGYIGGLFQLRRFVAGLFDSLNCYDLAAITQLAMSIIQDATGVEMYDSKWIFCQPFGFIPDGPLIGWPQFLDCNSPFFSKSSLPHYPAMDPARKSFGNHAWVEVTSTTGGRCVLDATHCLQATPNSPSNGTLGQINYLNASTDATRGPYAWVFTQNPTSTLAQIGVTGVGTVPAMANVLHPPLALEATDPIPINNATLNPESILTIAKMSLPSATIAYQDYLVGSRGCQVLVALEGLPESSKRMFVEITNFESLSDALSTFEQNRNTLLNLTDPEDHRTTNQVGNQAFQTSNMLLFRRNLLQLRVSVAGSALTEDGADELIDLINRVSKDLDTHIIDHSVKPGLEARPSPNLKDGQRAITVNSAKIFKVSLVGIEDVSDICIAEIQDVHVVQQRLTSLDRSHESADVEFLALQPGETSVTLCLAHSLNLSISTIQLTVKAI